MGIISRVFIQIVRNKSQFNLVVSSAQKLRFSTTSALGDSLSVPRLVIFDTTLRDGEQSPGVQFSKQDKLDIARELSTLGVDVIEAGYPNSSPLNFESVAAIARGSKEWASERLDGVPVEICAFSRCMIDEIKVTFDAIKEAPRKSLLLILATSDIHLEYKLKMTREQCLARTIECIKYARTICDDVKFGAEDCYRSDRDFVCRVFEAAIEAGASTVKIGDTVGFALPEHFANFVKYLKSNTRNADRVGWGVHCHNDLGLATSNTLAGISAGATEVDVTINGIGERAGNTALEEVVMAIRTHPASFPLSVSHINIGRLAGISDLVAKLSGMVVQPNKAIVGSNAFKHASGIHQDGVLKNATTYEIIPRESVGVTSTRYVIGKHSGRSGFRNFLLNELQLQLDEEKIQQAYQNYKRIME